MEGIVDYAHDVKTLPRRWKLATAVLSVIVSAVLVFSQSTGGSGGQGGAATTPQFVSPVTTDPCQSSAASKSSVVINVATAVTTQLVAVSGSTVIYVCGFVVTVGSTVLPNTLQFEYGTGGTCGAGTTVLTGALNTAGMLTGAINYGGAGESIFKTAAANALCVVSTVGTGPSIQGVVTYVQQ